MNISIERDTIKGKILVALSVMVAAALICSFIFIKSASLIYKIAKRDIENYQYDSAITLLEIIGNYKDSRQKLAQAYYSNGELLYASNDIEGARNNYKKAGGYSDSEKLKKETELILMLQGKWKSIGNGRTVEFDGRYIFSESLGSASQKIVVIDLKSKKIVPEMYLCTVNGKDNYSFYYTIENGKICRYDLESESSEFVKSAVFEKISA